MQKARLDELIRDDKYQLFLLSCPATLPISFGCHPWLVINNNGVVSRWEIFWKPEHQCRARWGHLHKDFYSPSQGIPKLFFSEKYLWSDGILHGFVEGGADSSAACMAEFVEASPHAYPFCFQYAFTGPNSNTYVQWVLDHFPESGLKLPWNAFGKSYAK